MRRRAFITLVGGAVAAWPLAARAQQPERMRRIGVLMNLPADDPESIARVAAFQEGLQDLGWTAGRNIQMDVRWAPGNFGDNRKYAADLVALAPDAILASTTVALGPLQELTRTIPIVFVNATDPVGGGYVEGLARPGGNATGFLMFEYSMSAKWLELLKEIEPRLNSSGRPARSDHCRRHRPVRRDPGRGAGARCGIASTQYTRRGRD